MGGGVCVINVEQDVRWKSRRRTGKKNHTTRRRKTNTSFFVSFRILGKTPTYLMYKWAARIRRAIERQRIIITIIITISIISLLAMGSDVGHGQKKRFDNLLISKHGTPPPPPPWVRLRTYFEITQRKYYYYYYYYGTHKRAGTVLFCRTKKKKNPLVE